MGTGVLRLYRSPLREGEPLYSLSNIDQGRYEIGDKKGEKKPKRQSVFPVIQEDGRMMWEMMDTEDNQAYCKGFLPAIENPPFAYSFESSAKVAVPQQPDPQPSAAVDNGAVTDSVDVEPKKRGRPARA